MIQFWIHFLNTVLGLTFAFTFRFTFVFNSGYIAFRIYFCIQLKTNFYDSLLASIRIRTYFRFLDSLLHPVLGFGFSFCIHFRIRNGFLPFHESRDFEKSRGKYVILILPSLLGFTLRFIFRIHFCIQH